MTTNSYAEVFPPGEFLKDELELRNWSQTEFAEIIGRPVRLVNEIIAGKKAITPETAVQLAAALGTSAELWMNLESQYQLSRLRQTTSAIQRKALLHGRFPVRDMAKRRWVDASDDIDVAEHEIRKFYGLDSLDAAPALPHAARKHSYEGVSMRQWSWLFRVKQVAEAITVPRYSRSRLIKALPDLRALMVGPEESSHVPRLLNEAGVRLVVVEALPGSKIDGACLWLDGGQPVIALSARLDRIDNFWFVLRHEIEHLLQEHGKADRMILDEDIVESGGSGRSPEERVADDAAAQFGVADAELESYMTRVAPYFFSRDEVQAFAQQLGVHPGIVVGRLQQRLAKQGQPDAYRYLREYLVRTRQCLVQAAPADGWGAVYPI